MQYGIVPSNELGITNWTARHHLAVQDPNQAELPLVALVKLTDLMANRFGDDGVLREGVAHLILGAQDLLAGPWGDRLDMGTVDSWLLAIAERISYDRDVQEFTD